ncbi:putative protein, partial [Arabidopsis thaliana]
HREGIYLNDFAKFIVPINENGTTESERKRGVVREDLISELPEDLLLLILSYLPTKKVITTKNVGRSLFLHKAPVLESFHLKVCDINDDRPACDDIDIGIWIGIAFERHVRELVLDLCLQKSVRFPISSMFSTLETLILKYLALVDVPSPVCMKSLRTLHLDCVNFKHNESFSNLISGCPNLEDLFMYQYYPLDVVMNFIIVAPSLKRLVIIDYREAGGYVINAPTLKYLKIKGLSHCGFCLIENAPVLVEAKIRNLFYIYKEKILGSLKSAKRLSLDLSPLECPIDSIFYQLVHLEIYTCKEEWWNLLKLMLDSSPKLQVLKLIGKNLDFKKVGMVGGKWNEPKNVPECLLSQLKMFVWTSYHWESEVEKEVATYILKNARQLKNVSFSTRPIHSKEHNKLEEKCKMLKELDGVVRASSSCHLVFIE